MSQKIYISEANPTSGAKPLAREMGNVYWVTPNFIPRNLPDGYTQIEYIESSGTQYINTGFAPNEKTACELEMSYTVISASNCGLFGAAGSTYQVDAFEGFFENTKFFMDFADTSLTQVGTTVAGDRYKIRLSQYEAYWAVNGETVMSVAPATQTFTSPSNFVLHALNRSGNIQYHSSSRTYSCKLWDDGTLVRDLVPCINPSGDVGLYDMVFGVFYGNAGTGVFTAGPGLQDVQMTHAMKKGYIVDRSFIPLNLPAGYTQVEYIESSGTQYINTGFLPNQNTKTEAEYSWVSGATSIFGARTDGTIGYLHFTELSGSVYKHFAMFGSSYTNTGIESTLGRTYICIDGVDRVITVNSTSEEFAAYTFQIPNPMYVMGFNDSGSVNIPSYAKLYWCKIYDNGTLVRDYIPCINPNGEIGLYDLENGTFYGNAGTGTFIAGPGVRNVTKLFYSSIIYPTSIEVTYTGTHNVSQVTGTDGKSYRLYTLTGSGTLTLSDAVDFWMCGGGYTGAGTSSGSNYQPGHGGLGGKSTSGTAAAGTYAITVGAASGDTKFGSLASTASAAYGSGYGGVVKAVVSSNSMTGEVEVITPHPGGYLSSTTPFGISSLYAHCAGGGGGGGGRKMNTSTMIKFVGGTGGSNGGKGTSGSGGSVAVSGVSAWQSAVGSGGSGGNRGGGAGGGAYYNSSSYAAYVPSSGSAATFYGSGGGGGGIGDAPNNMYSSGGAGYQGVVYLLVPLSA